MKKFSITFAGFALAALSMAAPADKGSIKCPVMTDNLVSVAKATSKHMYADYKGRRYYFCCKMCPKAFRQNPEKFRKNASLPIPKNKK